MAAMGTVGVLAMSAGFIFLYDCATQAERFGARKIDIQGMRRLSQADIFRQAQVKKGINIFSVNLPRARGRLLAHPWIAEAEISRIPPDELRIIIAEHTPVAIITLDQTYVMNTEGKIFKAWTASDPKQLPIVGGLEYEDLFFQEDEMSLPLRSVLDIIDLGKQKNSILPYRQLRSIQVDREAGITIHAYHSQLEIKLGYGEYPEKYAKLSKALAYLKTQSEFKTVRTIDLKSRNRIVVNPIRVAVTGKDKKEV